MEYDLGIIGAGWAGFNAAIRAKELGLKVVLIDKGPIGGTCLNRGCIPTKTLLQSAKIYSLVKKSSNFGIESQNPQVNFSQIQARKDKIIAQLRQGMSFSLKGIDFLNAEARILSNNTIKTGNQELKVRAILVACGSEAMELPNLKFDHRKIISSDDILNLKEIPATLLIIGGGVIGCEFASLFSSLGTKVTVAEKMPQLLPDEDQEVARKLENIFKKKGITVNTNTDATNLNLTNHDLVLLGIGRTPYYAGVGVEKISVDEYLRTAIPNIYAAGDCTGKIMLAHFAAYQGRIASENIAQPSSLKKADNNNVPNCIFTDPEIASVGWNEEKAKAQGIDLKITKFDFMGSAMARILDETEGFVKIISDQKTGQVLGASIIGARATELIAILTLAVSNRLNISGIRSTIFAHPTLSEAIGEALNAE